MKYCSLGECCRPAHSLKLLGLKTESYPFDWLFSSPNIVESSIKDDFSMFLDKSNYVNIEEGLYPGEDVCRHKIFDDSSRKDRPTFRHADPLNRADHYDYLVRCVERFRDLLSSKEQKVFFKLHSCNHSDQVSAIVETVKLYNFLSNYTENYKLVVVRIYKNGKHEVSTQHATDLLFANLSIIDETDGFIFTDRDEVYVQETLSNLLKSME